MNKSSRITGSLKALLWTLPLLWISSCGQKTNSANTDLAESSTVEEKINPGGLEAEEAGFSELSALSSDELGDAYTLACSDKKNISERQSLKAHYLSSPLDAQLTKWGEHTDKLLEKICTPDNKAKILEHLNRHQKKLEQHLADLKSGQALEKLKQRLIELKDGSRLKEISEQIEELEKELAVATEEREKRHLKRRIADLEKRLERLENDEHLAKKIKHLEEIIASYDEWSKERIAELEKALVELKTKIGICEKA